MMTDGQRLALEQLKDIVDSSKGAFEIIKITEPTTDQPLLGVFVSWPCEDIDRVEGGLPLRSRERFNLWITPGFPFTIPKVWTSHSRFANFNHVQWGKYLCIYQSPATEWNVADGMYGFIERLDLWLRRAATGEWEAAGEPLHPPITYLSGGDVKIVIPRADTPDIRGVNWYGTAHLTSSDNRVDICGWSELFADDTPANVAAAILLNEPMPFEFPGKIKDLLDQLTERGVPKEKLLLVLQAATLANGKEDPLYIIVGSPMRGVAGDGDLKQHLTAWYIPPTIALGLRLAIEKYSENETLREIGENVEKIIFEWADAASIEWCRVLEARNEIVIRRDSDSPMNWFQGKTVSLWGCGALGGHIAESLTRAGVQKLILRDWDNVTPGILVRQPFNDNDIGRSKVEALEERLTKINPGLNIDVSMMSVLDRPLSDLDITDGADVIIDTTASNQIRAKLEYRRKGNQVRPRPIVSMAVGHKAERALLAIAGAEYSGGALDVVRKAKLEACRRSFLSHFADEFWPLRDGERRRVFQPEPGCSESTFVGSDADLGALASTMLNLAAKDLGSINATDAVAHFFTQPHARSTAQEQLHNRFVFVPDLINEDPHEDYEVRIADSAWNDLMAWIEKSRRLNGPDVETGGLLFGERDDATRIVWITEIIGPPSDSLASELHFVCGTANTTEINNEKKCRTRESVQYIGMWHSHPNSSPRFSSTDFEGMRQLMRLSEKAASFFVFMAGKFK